MTHLEILKRKLFLKRQAVWLIEEEIETLKSEIESLEKPDGISQDKKLG